MVGSLVRTMVEFSLQTTGLAVSYIELSQGVSRHPCSRAGRVRCGYCIVCVC